MLESVSIEDSECKLHNDSTLSEKMWVKLGMTTKKESHMTIRGIEMGHSL